MSTESMSAKLNLKTYPYFANSKRMRGGECTPRRSSPKPTSSVGLNPCPPTTHCMLCDDGDQPAGFALLYDHNPIARTMKISGGMFEQARIHSTTKRCCTAQIDFAFEFFNLHRLEAEVLELNVVAQIYEIDYLGFMIEGRRRQAVYKLGQYYDSLYLGLLREEWGRDLDQLNLNVNKAAAQRWIERSRKKFGS
jgi:hypothetical protein